MSFNINDSLTFLNYLAITQAAKSLELYQKNLIMKIQKFKPDSINEAARASSSIEAQDAVKKLLNFITTDLPTEVLQNTPNRVVKSFQEIYRGYDADIEHILNKKFFDIAGYGGQVLLENISFTSTCEHHMLPFWGAVDFAYVPNKYVVGLSKIARLVDAYAARLQLQERMTAQIASSFNQHLKPKGVAIRVRGEHSCMRSRGVCRKDATLQTIYFTGCYENDTNLQYLFINSLNK